MEERRVISLRQKGGEGFMQYKVTIVGTGNAGCAHAAMFSLYGHQVTLLKTSSAGNNLNFNYIKRERKIDVVTPGGDVKSVTLHRVTDNCEEAFSDCEVCFVMVQTLYHPRVAELISACVKHIKLLFVVPGYMGSLYFQKMLGDRVDYIAEGESTAYDARIVEDGRVQILFKNVRNAIGILKGREEDILPIMSSLVETYQYVRKSIVESALHNPNLIVHTVGSIMSASRIEFSHGNFWMYKEAFTPSIWHVIARLDNEKMDVLEAAGCERIPYVEACKFRNSADLTVDAMEVFRSYAESGGPKGPSCVASRYIMEDVPMGLGLLSSLGRKYQVPTPTCDALLTIAGALVGHDFWKESRNLIALMPFPM